MCSINAFILKKLNFDKRLFSVKYNIILTNPVETETEAAYVLF